MIETKEIKMDWPTTIEGIESELHQYTSVLTYDKYHTTGISIATYFGGIS